MDASAPRDLFGCFDDLPDPRVERTRHHRLDDILAIAILATLCGADGWTSIAHFGRDRHPWLKTFLALPNGILSHDTFGRVFAALAPHAFERCFLLWVQGLVRHSDCGALHIDGKSLRRSFESAGKKTPLHMVSVWASKAELALAQVATRCGKNKKGSEIKAIPRLLDLITLHGAVVTIDAMGCQKEIARKILDGGGHDLLAVKDNQKTLHEEIKLLFDQAIPQRFEGMGYDFHQEVDGGHGRVETRRVWVTREVDWLRQWGQWQRGVRGGGAGVAGQEAQHPAPLLHQRPGPPRPALPRPAVGGVGAWALGD